MTDLLQILELVLGLVSGVSRTVAFVDHVDEVCHVNDDKEHGEITDSEVDCGSDSSQLRKNVHNIEVFIFHLGLREPEEQLDFVLLSLRPVSVIDGDVVGVSLFQLRIDFDYLLQLIHEGDDETEDGLVGFLADVLVLDGSGLQTDHGHLLLEQGLLGGLKDLHGHTIRSKVIELFLVYDLRGIEILVELLLTKIHLFLLDLQEFEFRLKREDEFVEVRLGSVDQKDLFSLLDLIEVEMDDGVMVNHCTSAVPE